MDICSGHPEIGHKNLEDVGARDLEIGHNHLDSVGARPDLRDGCCSRGSLLPPQASGRVVLVSFLKFSCSALSFV